MKIPVFDPLRRELQLADMEAKISDMAVAYWRSEVEVQNKRIRRLQAGERVELKRVKAAYEQYRLYLDLLLVVLGELLVIAAYGLSK